MEKKKLSDLTSTELIAKEKTLKTTLGVSVGILSGVLVLMIIFSFVEKQLFVGLPMIVIALGSGIALINILRELKATKSEIGNRAKSL